MKTKILFFFYLFSFIFALNAQWQAMPDSNLWPTSPDSGLVIDYGYNPLIVSDDEGGAIVAYRTNMQVKVKRVDRWGALQWNGWNGVVAGGIEDEQMVSDIAEDDEGGILVAFTDVDQISVFDAYIYATVQHIDHNGTKLWGNGIRVAVLDSIIQINPQIASDGKGGCIVNLLDNRFAPDPFWPYFDIYVQRIDSLGNRCWGDSAFRLTDSTRSHASNPMMLVNENSETFFSWWDGLTFRMQKLDFNGNKLWIDTGIPTSNLPAKISMSDGNGGFYLTGVLYMNNIYRISCNHVDSTGQKLWGNDGITLVDSVLFGSGQSDVTGMLFDDTENVIISYSFAKSGGQSDKYLQKLTPTGVKLFGDEGIPVSNYVSRKRGGGIICSENDLLCIWLDNRPISGTYIQKLDYFGNHVWNNDILFSTDAFHDFTNDGNGGFIIVDHDIDFSISLLKISKNGIIGQVLTNIDNSLNHSIAMNFKLYQNYPNPFNGKTIIKYWLNKSENVQLQIYNINGKIIQNNYIPKQMQGEHQIKIDMNDFASGLYFYQLILGNHSQTKKFLLIK